VPFLGDGDVVSDVEPLVELVRTGAFGLTLMAAGDARAGDPAGETSGGG
jgi:hypothetical protein